jgi:hypothetical protein
MRKISIEGVLVGGIVGLVISYSLGIAMTLSLYGLVNQTHLATGRFVNVAWLYAPQLAISLCCSMLGGYVSARIAGHDELLNGAASAFLNIVFGLLPVVLRLFGTGFGMSSNLPWEIFLPPFLLLIASPAFGLLGGYLRLRQTRRLQPA